MKKIIIILLSLSAVSCSTPLNNSPEVNSSSAVFFSTPLASESGYDIYKTEINKDAKVKINKSKSDSFYFDVSRDGSKIVYISNNSELNISGTNLSIVAKDNKKKKFPKFSPDGNKIVYVAEDENKNTDIWLVNTDGSNNKKLTDSGASDDSPVWSPDGGKIAFTSRRDGNNEIYTMTSDGSGQLNITESASEDYSPAWSSDSKSIAFTAKKDDKWNINIIKTDGSGSRKLTTGNEDIAPLWSPDNNYIAYIAKGGLVNDKVSNKITIFDLSKNSSELVNAEIVNTTPAWSSGKGLVFISSGNNGNQISLYDLNNKQVQKISSAASNIFNPLTR